MANHLRIGIFNALKTFPMLLLLLAVVLLVAVGFFFIVPILLNRQEETKTDVLDLDEFTKMKEKEPLMRDDSEDMMV